MTLRSYLTCLLTVSLLHAAGQEPGILSVPGRMGAGGRNTMRSLMSGNSPDSMRRRNKQEDSITISYKLLDRPGNLWLDSTISDATRRFPIKATTLHLGNVGSASHSLLFSPVTDPGFDQGQHGYDLYRWTASDVRFFSTTRPYSEINYQLGSRVEQLINLLHTQNIKPNWNFLFQYRLINAPGIFQHQRSNHNNYMFSSRYQSFNQRYQVWMYLLGNQLQSEENGGIVDSTGMLNDPIYADRFNIPVWLGGADNFTANFFSNKISTGNRYQSTSFFWRHQYDLGKKDSLVTDSSVVPLFYPRVRFEHQLLYEKQVFSFFDSKPQLSYYNRFYRGLPASFASLALRDSWRSFSNQFSVYQFPDARNLQQYIKLGVQLQMISGQTALFAPSFFNAVGQFLYRNLTRNKKWDMELGGQLFFAGDYAGNYQAKLQLQRLLSNKRGSLVVGALSTKRNPSFVFDKRSSFFLTTANPVFKPEYHTRLFTEVNLSKQRTTLGADYWLVGHYTYFKSFQEPFQNSTWFNVVQLSLKKTFCFARHFYWHTEFYYQQRVGSAELNLMPFFTRQRLAYEGNLGYKNLDIAMGLEFRYRPPYKADRYAPVQGQFFYQDSVTIKNPLPDMSAYVNFRIRPFTAFIRAENLNTARDLQGFGFTRNNLLAEGYPLQGLHLRIGIFWQFVN